MSFENREYPKVRVSKKAHAHLAKVLPGIREARGVNVSMTDIVSELIMSIPEPVNVKAAGVNKRKAVRTSAAVPAL